MSNKPEPGEPAPFSPSEFAAWRGMLRVHSKVFRELDRRLLAAHGLGVDAYGGMITLVSAPDRRLPSGRPGPHRNRTPPGISRRFAPPVIHSRVGPSANPERRRSRAVGLTAAG